ncbi:MAG: polysaccharide deacetylase family protein [Puniceicoccales bacterium]
MKWWLLLQCVILKSAGLWMAWSTGLVELGAVVFFLGGFITVGHLLIPHWQGACSVATHFDGPGKTLWLTIDDGPDPQDTPRILELLAQHRAKATFFMIGERAAAHPELVAAVREAGHEIACHTHRHPKALFWALGSREVARELDDALDAIELQGGDVSRYRSPVGIKNFFLGKRLAERGLTYIGWTIRSGDALGRDVTAIVERVRRRLRPGAIILMHEGDGVAPDVRVKAIKAVLELCTRDGYAFVLPTAQQLRPAPVEISPPLTSTKDLLCN